MLRLALLGLLVKGPGHGYDLKAAFEELLGGTWPLNIGQVYTTMARLERDGLVTSTVVPQEGLPDRKVYSLTAAGQAELKRWLAEPIGEPFRLKDELLVKVLVHDVADGDAIGLVWAQREQHLRALAGLATLRGDSSLDVSTRLVIEKSALHIEADLAWLDHCEEQLQASAAKESPTR